MRRHRPGRDPDALALSLHLPTFAWPGEDRWARIRDHHWHVVWKYEDMEHARGRTGPPAPAPPFPTSREAELRAGIVLGTPEQVAEQLQAFQEAAGGPLHYVARLYWPGMDPGLQREALRVFAEGVLPLMR